MGPAFPVVPGQLTDVRALRFLRSAAEEELWVVDLDCGGAGSGGIARGSFSALDLVSGACRHPVRGIPSVWITGHTW